MTIKEEIKLRIGLFESISENNPFFAHGKMWIKSGNEVGKELMKAYCCANFALDPIDTVVVDLTGYDGHSVLPMLIDAQSNKYEARNEILKHLSERDIFAMNTCEALSIMCDWDGFIEDDVDIDTVISMDSVKKFFKEKISSIEGNGIIKYDRETIESLREFSTPKEGVDVNLYEWCDELRELARRTANTFYQLYSRNN